MYQEVQGANTSLLSLDLIPLAQDHKDVQNDTRFLEIWLKYAAISSQPLDVYDFMYKSGVCTQQV